jgi:hypothetical protein
MMLIILESGTYLSVRSYGFYYLLRFSLHVYTTFQKLCQDL